MQNSELILFLMGYEYNFRRGLRGLHGFFSVVQCCSAAFNPCNPRNPRLNYYQHLVHFFFNI